MYKALLCTCRAIVLLIKAFVLPRSRCRCRRGFLKVPNLKPISSSFISTVERNKIELYFPVVNLPKRDSKNF